MREAEFREWLGKRLWKGEPLTKKASDNWGLRSLRAERRLQGLGFPYETVDQLFDDGTREELLARLTTLMNEPEPDLAIVRAVVPQAEEPKRQGGAVACHLLG